MKKVLLTAAAVFVTLSIYAQGTVDFKNDNTALIRNSLTGSPATFANGISVALYWAPLSDPNNFTQLGNPVTVGGPAPPVPGQFVGGTRTTGVATAPATDAWFVVKAWEVAYGATFEIASTAPAMGGRPALRGESDAFRLTTGSILTTPANLQGPYNNGTPMNTADDLPGFQGLTVVVPEPSAIVFCLFTAIGASIFARRFRCRG
jgi:hypothetical protein